MMSEPPTTRASLILRLRHAADAVAWQEFVDIYQPLVFRIVRSRGLQDADALDTTQEVLARVASAINRFDPDPRQGTFRGWLRRITRNLVIEFLRSKNRLPQTSDASAIQRLIEEVPAPSSESILFDLEHQRQIFAWASEKIKPNFKRETWLAFWQTAVENQPVANVARELKMSAGAVYIARSRVMAQLRIAAEQHTVELFSNEQMI